MYKEQKEEESESENNESFDEEIEDKPKREKSKQPKLKSVKKPKGEKLFIANTTFRSNMQSMIKLMEEIELNEEHVKLLKKTPFWLLLDTFIHKKLKADQCLKHDEVVANIIQSYNGKFFHIAGKQVKFTKNEVRLIFGIRDGDKEMKFTYCAKKSVPMLKRRNIALKRLTAKNVIKILNDCLKKNTKENVENVRLICLHLCVSLFFSVGGTSVNWRYMDCV